MITYKQYVEPYLSIFTTIQLEVEKAVAIKQFVKEVVKKKKLEKHHKIDGHREMKRWFTGFGGEAAIESLLGVDFIDFSIGDSGKYHISDLSILGLNIGVKTVEYGKFPVIFKKSYQPEIIVLKKSDLEFLVCGVASISILNKYQSDELILSPSLRARGTKTGFYGFSELIQFRDLDDLRTILNGK